MYVKESFSVESRGKSVETIAYVMVPGHSAGMPSSWYYQTIADGYQQLGFGLNVLQEALDRSRNQMDQEMSLRGGGFYFE